MIGAGLEFLWICRKGLIDAGNGDFPYADVRDLQELPGVIVMWLKLHKRVTGVVPS